MGHPLPGSTHTSDRHINPGSQPPPAVQGQPSLPAAHPPVESAPVSTLVAVPVPVPESVPLSVPAVVPVSVAVSVNVPVPGA